MTVVALDMDRLKPWIGKTETLTDQITPVPAAALSALLDRNDPFPRTGDPLPPLWHWLYFLPHARQSELGADGHPARGGFLPPVPLARRMWAGSRLEFRGTLRIGDTITRSSKVLDVSAKQGRAGTLVFVKTRHEIGNAENIAVIEEHDIVYRDPPRPDAPAPEPTAAPRERVWAREIRPDAVMLFRYSALTFNGHRIHYDYPYVTQVEGYPGLVVHGPLVATLLLDLLRRHRPRAPIAGFSFRALQPLFAPTPFLIYGVPPTDGSSIRLGTRDADGWMTMDATATFAEQSTA